jgi:hypothetical protein
MLTAATVSGIALSFPVSPAMADLISPTDFFVQANTSVSGVNHGHRPDWWSGDAVHQSNNSITSKQRGPLGSAVTATTTADLDV